MEKLNPTDPAFRRDPYAFYAEARAEGAVLCHPLVPTLCCFRYAETAELLTDGVNWSTNFVPAAEARGQPLPPQREDLPPSMLFQDGAAHARLRGLVGQAFSPRVLRRADERIQEITSALLDEMLSRGTADLIEGLATPLPLAVISEVIGVPVADHARFKKWSDFLVETMGGGLFGEPPSLERMRAQVVVIDEMRDYFRDLAARRREDPRDDLLSGLVAAEVDGSRLTHDETLQMVILLLVAGNETTRSLIGNAVCTLLEHPDQLARLRADPSLLPTAIDEVLRFSSPIQLTGRRSARDQVLSGHEIRQHELVMVWLGSANRDPEVFEAPDHFDITRTPNPHLSFGLGPHQCLGAPLARREAEVAIGQLLARTSSFARSTSGELPLHTSFIFKAVTQLPLELKPA